MAELTEVLSGFTARSTFPLVIIARISYHTVQRRVESTVSPVGYFCWHILDINELPDPEVAGSNVSEVGLQAEVEDVFVGQENLAVVTRADI